MSAAVEVNVPRRMACRVMIPNQVSIWLIHEDPTGVKWKVMFGLRANHFRTSGVSWVDRLSNTTWISLPAWGLTAFLMNARKSGPVRRGEQSAKTSPVVVFNAANRLVVPCRW